MKKVEEAWRRLEKVGEGWKRLEKVGNDWKQVGEGWKRLGEVGKLWGRLDMLEKINQPIEKELKDMVKSNKLGKKTKEGFYRY